MLVHARRHQLQRHSKSQPARKRRHWAFDQRKSRYYQKIRTAIFLIMDFEQARQDILTWVTDFVERPNTQLAGWPPCPYARRARLDGEFDIRQGRIDPWTDLRAADMGKFTVIAHVYDPKTIDAAEFNRQIDSVNRGFLLPRNIIALADHPDSPEEVQGVRMNQGRWAIAFIQPLDKLNHFARVIADRGYYRDWPEPYLQDLFSGRQDPRA